MVFLRQFICIKVRFSSKPAMHCNCFRGLYDFNRDIKKKLHHNKLAWLKKWKNLKNLMYIIATVRNFVKISEHFGAKGLQIFFSVIQVAAAIVVYVSCCAISHQHDFAAHFLASCYNIRMTNKITTFC